MGNSQSAPELPIDFGTEIERFTGKYVGSVPVGAAKGNDVCVNAVDRICQLKLPERTVDLRVTTTGIYLIDAKTGDIIKEVEIKEVSFVAQDPKDKKLVSFFENDQHIRVITCHTFRVAKGGHMIPLAIREAFNVLSGKAEAPQAAGANGNKRKLSKAESKKLAVAEGGASKGFTLGEELKRFEGWEFLGVANVSTPKGEEIVTEANERIDTFKARKAVIVLHDNGVNVMAAKSLDVLFSTSLGIISYYHMSEDKSRLSFITHDRRLDKIQCASMSLEGGDTDEELRATLMAQQKEMVKKIRQQKQQAAGLKKSRSTTSLGSIGSVGSQGSTGEFEKEEATGKIIGVFEASYIGTAKTKASRGEEATAEAVEFVQAQKNIVPEGMFVQVGTEGVRLIDALSHEVTNSYVLKNVTYSSVAGKAKTLFAFFTRDDTLGLNHGHVFQCVGERAFDIATSFGEAFKAYKEEQDRIGNDPFKGHGKVRDLPTELKDCGIERSELAAKKPIGAGQFGQVFLATQGQDETKRAVKMLRGGASKSDRAEFVREAAVMTDLQHENLVQLVGVSMAQRPWLMVLEFLQYGDLRGVLRGCDAVGIELTEGEQLNCCLQVARGMEFLASKRLIHMDLAARNVLLNANNLCKVADFGLTRRLPDDKDFWHSEGVLKLPIKWCSIEALDERVFSEASDVWAFGVVMWEVFSYGVTPYEKFKTQEVQRKVREGHRLPQPKGCSDVLYGLWASCWRTERAKRPTFANLAAELSTYLRTASSDSQARDLGAALKQATMG